MERPTHSQLVAALVKGPHLIIQSITEFTADLWHGATGIAGEGGELLEGIMNLQGNFTASDLHKVRENVVEELGDLEFYIEQLYQRSGLNRAVAYAGDAIISPDMVLHHGASVAVFASQVLDTVKKAAIYNKPLDSALLSMQLYNLDYAMDAIRKCFGITRLETLEHNISKLLVRYEGMIYSDRAAQDRADKCNEGQNYG